MLRFNRTFSQSASHQFVLVAVLLLLPVLVGSSARAADSTFTLTFEAVRYGELQAVIGKHLIVETISPSKFSVAIFEYRLDRADEAGKIDSMLVLKNEVALPSTDDGQATSESDRRSLTVIMPEPGTLRLAPVGDTATIGGLKSYKYALGAEGSVEMYVWFAEPPAGLAKYNWASMIEAGKRSGTFVMSEFLRQTVRTAASDGIEWPPQSSKRRTDMIVVRIDTAVDSTSLLARDNSYLVELRSVSPVTQGAAKK